MCIVIHPVCSSATVFIVYCVSSFHSKCLANVVAVLELLKNSEHELIICVDLKMVNFLLGQQVAIQNIVKKKNILVSSACGTAEPKRDTGNKTWKRLACKKTPDSWWEEHHQWISHQPLEDYSRLCTLNWALWSIL